MRTKTNKLVISIVLIASLFCGLATHADGKHQPKVNSWNLSGKFAVRRGNEVQSVSLRWQQRQDHLHLFVFSPIANQAVTIDGTPGDYTITDIDGQSEHVGDLHHSTFTDMQIIIPFDHLRYWITGHAAPNTPITKQTSNRDGYCHTLIQDDWQIEYIAYTTDSASQRLPHKIVLKNGDVTLKLNISSWSTGRSAR